MFTLPLDRLRAPITGAALAVSRERVGAVLRAARAGKVRVILNLAGGKDNVRGSDGRFDLSRWKARIDQYRDVDFAPYVEEGLILAHLLVDEPYAAPLWGGQEISRADIEAMARYSKSIWPTLPTAVRAPPAWLVAGDTTYSDLDIAWAQWAGPERAGGNWRTPEDFRDENVARAKQLGLGLIVGRRSRPGSLPACRRLPPARAPVRPAGPRPMSRSLLVVSPATSQQVASAQRWAGWARSIWSSAPSPRCLPG